MIKNQPYLTFSKYLQHRYGYKMKKIALSTPCTCPNRDGTIATGGCYYCNNESFNPVLARHSADTIRNQLRQGLSVLNQGGFPNRVIAFFQTYSNTYGSLADLRQWYFIPLEFEEVKVISIATRPDCIHEDVMALLDELSYQREVWLEIGLQSSSDKVLQLINRGHTVEDFTRICEQLHRNLPQIRLSTHLIFGLPGETMADIHRAAVIVNDYHLQGVKIHPLAIVKNTVMADWLVAGKIELISLHDYVDRVITFIHHLNPGIAIERISEDSKDLLIAPLWVSQKQLIWKMIDEGLKKREGTIDVPSSRMHL